MTNTTENAASRLLASLEQLASTANRLNAVIEKSKPIVLAGSGPNPQKTASTLYADLLKSRKSAEETGKQFQLLQKLVDTSALITSSLALDDVLKEVIDTIVSLTGAERVYLMLRDDKTGNLETRAARNWNKESIAEGEITFSQGIIDTAIQAGKPILTTNALSNIRFQDLSSVYDYQLRSIVCIPLMRRSKNIGVLYADNRLRKSQFSQETATILEAFAHQTAIAIENARLYEQVQRELDEAQKVVQRLRIRIDQQHTHRQISEIENTDFFRKLRESVVQDEQPSPPKEDSSAPGKTGT